MDHDTSTAETFIRLFIPFYTPCNKAGRNCSVTWRRPAGSELNPCKPRKCLIALRTTVQSGAQLIPRFANIVPNARGLRAPPPRRLCKDEERGKGTAGKGASDFLVPASMYRRRGDLDQHLLPFHLLAPGPLSENGAPASTGGGELVKEEEDKEEVRRALRGRRQF